MIIKTANFVKSSAKYTQCPEMDFPEFAFIGRSNVGKSSLINAITNHKKLAKTSGTPGKTQLINHFVINENWFLVDLPGYGFAKISKKMRAEWEVMIADYLYNRESLMNTFILVDSRIKPQKLDLDLIANYGENGLPFTIVFTKTDKLKDHILKKNIAEYKRVLLESWEVLPHMIITSSVDKRGTEELLTYIENSIPLFYEEESK